MLALIRQSGFDLEQLLEIRPPGDSTTRYPFITLDWAQRWPCEEVWKARKLP
jgi:hypothetical protein